MWSQPSHQAVGLSAAPADYLAAVKNPYARDACNSLAIERFRVTNKFIERAASIGWNPAQSQADERSRDALAARGCRRARIEVEAFIARALTGANPGIAASRDHRNEYFELLAPSVTAGIRQARDMAGYRAHLDDLQNAAHVPPLVEVARDMMPAMWELLESEPKACEIRGHFVFVFTHPCPDGNGRMGKFLMYAIMASGGYRWTVIELERRSDRVAALGEASSREHIVLFAECGAASMRREAELHRAKPRLGKASARRRRPNR